MLTIIADFRAHPDRIDFLKAEMEKLIPVTQAEEGCVQYDLHHDNADRAHFMFYETWESRELWRKHSDAAHVVAFAKATAGAIAAFQLYEMTRLD